MAYYWVRIVSVLKISRSMFQLKNLRLKLLPYVFVPYLDSSRAIVYCIRVGLIKANVHMQKEITQFSLYMSGQWSKLEIVIPETRYLRRQWLEVRIRTPSLGG